MQRSRKHNDSTFEDTVTRLGVTRRITSLIYFRVVCEKSWDQTCAEMRRLFPFLPGLQMTGTNYDVNGPPEGVPSEVGGKNPDSIAIGPTDVESVDSLIPAVSTLVEQYTDYTTARQLAAYLCVYEEGTTFNAEVLVRMKAMCPVRRVQT